MQKKGCIFSLLLTKDWSLSYAPFDCLSYRRSSNAFSHSYHKSVASNRSKQSTFPTLRNHRLKHWWSFGTFHFGFGFSLPGAHRVADGAVADEGGHRGGPRHASRLPGLTDGSNLPRAAAHPQLPGANSSQRPRPAKR